MSDEVPPIKRGRGRPPKLTPAIQAKIVQAIKGGNYRSVAAQWAGVSETTLGLWMGRTGAIYSEFRKAVLEAEQEAEIRMVALVATAAKDDARHAQWWLERKVPERWGRKDRMTVDVARLSDAELASAIAALSGGRGPAAGAESATDPADAGDGG